MAPKLSVVAAEEARGTAGVGPVRASTAMHAPAQMWQFIRACRHDGVARVHVLAARSAPSTGALDEHTHAVPTLLLCLHGVARVIAARGAIDLGPNEALAIAPGAWHAHPRLRGGAYAYGQGIASDTSDVALNMPGHDERLLLPREPSGTLLRRLVAEDDAARRCALVGELLAQLDGKSFGYNHAPAQSRMFHFLWRNLHRPVTAAQVLAASGVSRSHAKRLFQAAFGESPKAALLRAHLQLAEQLLREGASVGEAALASGFTSRADLTRAWRRAYGTTPSGITPRRATRPRR